MSSANETDYSGPLTAAELAKHNAQRPATWQACDCGGLRQPMAAEAATDEGAGAADMGNRWAIFLLAIAGCGLAIAAIAVFGLHSSANAHELTPENAAACQAEGGCRLISRDMLVDQIQRAYRAGQAKCGVEL